MLPHLDEAYTVAYYLLRDEQAASDAVQESCLRALRYFAGYRGENARAWLLAIVRRCCATARTQRRRDDAHAVFDERLHSEQADTVTPETLLQREDAQTAFRRALDALSPAFREVLVLRELEEMSYDEIAVATGVPVGTVMSRLSRARLRMQQALKEHRDVR